MKFYTIICDKKYTIEDVSFKEIFEIYEHLDVERKAIVKIICELDENSKQVISYVYFAYGNYDFFKDCKNN